MATILEVQKKVESFFRQELLKKGNVKEIAKTDEGWYGLFEALEENELLKEKGYPVTDRVFYKIELDEGLNTTSYGVYDPRKEESPGGA